MSESFDFASFYRAVVATVAARGVSWKSVSEETGVSQSTLSRMATGRQPDAASLTAIASWSGLNPVDFYGTPPKAAEPMAMVGALLRSDPRLDDKGADALEAIIMAAYERFRSSDTD
jgi:transcriptional regulator with XRE-family HTH domain